MGSSESWAKTKNTQRSDLIGFDLVQFYFEPDVYIKHAELNLLVLYNSALTLSSPLHLQNKPESETEVKKFDRGGEDKDLIETLERDIISQNPNVKWCVYLFLHPICCSRPF